MGLLSRQLRRRCNLLDPDRPARYEIHHGPAPGQTVPVSVWPTLEDALVACADLDAQSTPTPEQLQQQEALAPLLTLSMPQTYDPQHAQTWPAAQLQATPPPDPYACIAIHDLDSDPDADTWYLYKLQGTLTPTPATPLPRTTYFSQ